MAQAQATSGATTAFPHFDLTSPDMVARLTLSLRTAVAALCALLVFFTFTPFAAGSLSAEEASRASGNALNQVGYIGMAGIAFLALAALAERRRLLFLAQWQWLVLGGILILSMAAAPNSDLAMRGIFFTLVGMSITAAIVLLPRTEADFRAAMTFAVVLVLAVSYFGVLVLRDHAVHLEADAEGHSGLWRGIYSHKNFAGPVMAGLTLYGIYAMRSGSRLLGLVIIAASAFFVLQTGSKTTAGFLPLAIAVVSLRRVFGSASLVIAAHIVLVVLVAVLTVGSAFNPAIEAVTRHIIADTTFTGRDDIWRFGVANMPGGLFGSYGFYGFWGTDIPLMRELDPRAAWDVRLIVSGHTNLIDTVLHFGFLPAAVVLFVLLVLPAWHYRNACRIPENRRAADFFMMTVTLMGMISSLETFFFARAMTMWLFFFLAVFGLACLGRNGRRFWPDEAA
jgi:Lipid A core - O-antigen ligase and related enzymes